MQYIFFRNEMALDDNDNNNNNNNNNVNYNNNGHNQFRLTKEYGEVVFASSIEYYSRLNSVFIDALSIPFKDARGAIK